MVSNDFESLPSFLLGIKVNKLVSRILLSFIKKNEINKTDNKPTLNEPKAPKTKFNISGIALN